MIPENVLTNLRKKLEVMAKIPDTEWDYFTSMLDMKTIRKGEKMLAVGDHPKDVAFVINGLIKKQISKNNGAIFIKDFSWTGEFVASYVAMLTNTPSLMDYIAIEDTDLVFMVFDNFKSLYPRNICWQQIGRLVAEQMFIVHEQRELELLIFSPIELYEKMKEKLPHLTPRLKQAEIAAYLGITPESLSRLTKRRRDQGRQK